MSQLKTRTCHVGGRLFKSAASTAFTLSALAAGAMLSSGEVKACNLPLGLGDSDTCTFSDPAVSPAPTTDRLTVLKVTGLTNTFTNLELTGLLSPNPQMQIDTDFNPPYTGGPVTAVYQLEKLTPGWFDGYFVTLNGANGSGVLPTIFKEIGTGYDSATNTITGLLSSATQSGVGSTGLVPLTTNPTTIFIKDTFTPNNGSIDNGLNQFRQAPGPLPILGAGAAFGFSRKLRSRIKAARTV